MKSHTRALIAASAFAVLTGKKVAGVFDHTNARRLKIAAEARGEKLQAFDGERSIRFGGTLPELYDEGDKSHISFEVIGDIVRGHDRGSGSNYSAQVTNGVAQVFDYAEDAWFDYDIQDPQQPRAFHRAS